MLYRSVDELDRHRQLESVVLRYSHAPGQETVYQWGGRAGKPSDCWMTKDGRVYLPADGTSVLLTEFFDCEVIICGEVPAQRVRYIRMKQLKDVEGSGTNKLWIEANGVKALAGEEDEVFIA